MAVKLQFASCEQRLHFISERLDREKQYLCPFCTEEVIIRKGDKKSHHFAHKPDSICNVNAETVLHFEAKNYLKTMINKNKADQVIISFPADSNFALINFLSLELNLNSTMDISLKQIMDYYSAKVASVEMRIPTSSYVADIYCIPKLDKNFVLGKGLVLEVFVTHEMEMEKRVFLETTNIPYLELIPSYNNQGTFDFALASYQLYNFFDTRREKLNEILKEYLFPLYEGELIEKVEKELSLTKVLDYKIQAVEALTNEFAKEDSFELYSALLSRLDNQSIKTRITSYMTEVKREESLTDIQYIKTANGKALMGVSNNKKHFISSEQNLLHEILSVLLGQVEINALIGNRVGQTREDLIVGIDLMIPQPSKLEDIVKDTVVNVLQGYIHKFENKKNEVALKDE